MSDEKNKATVVDVQLRIRVNHADYELAYGNGVGDLPDYATEQASEVVKEQLRRLGWGEVIDVKSSHWTTAAAGEDTGGDLDGRGLPVSFGDVDPEDDDEEDAP